MTLEELLFYRRFLKKVNTFEEYLSCEKALSFDQMRMIHEAVIEEIKNDPDAVELYEDLRSASIRYAAIRAEWSIMTREQKLEQDRFRTALHDTVIMQTNVLARYLRQTGKSALWRDSLGDEETDRIFRKVIGDLACYIAFVNSICTR